VKAPRLLVARRGLARRRISDGTIAELGRRVRRAMRAAAADGEVSLSLSDDQELLALNRQYADEDHATDVLSFCQEDAEFLGDIVISVETATRQAKTAGHSLLAELTHLAVHGLVHLLGYDHATADEERIMFGYEARLRAQALPSGPIRRQPRP